MTLIPFARFLNGGGPSGHTNSRDEEPVGAFLVRLSDLFRLLLLFTWRLRASGEALGEFLTEPVGVLRYELCSSLVAPQRSL